MLKKTNHLGPILFFKNIQSGLIDANIRIWLPIRSYFFSNPIFAKRLMQQRTKCKKLLKHEKAYSLIWICHLYTNMDTPLVGIHSEIQMFDTGSVIYPIDWLSISTGDGFHITTKGSPKLGLDFTCFFS